MYVVVPIHVCSHTLSDFLGHFLRGAGEGERKKMFAIVSEKKFLPCSTRNLKQAAFPRIKTEWRMKKKILASNCFENNWISSLTGAKHRLVFGRIEANKHRVVVLVRIEFEAKGLNILTNRGNGRFPSKFFDGWRELVNPADMGLSLGSSFSCSTLGRKKSFCEHH